MPFAQVLGNMDSVADAQIKDVNAKWYYQPVLIASEAGFFGSRPGGYSSGNAAGIAMTAQVQRQFAAFFISNMLDSSAISTDAPAFSDMDQVDTSFIGPGSTSNMESLPTLVADKIATMFNAGIINGYEDGTFKPLGTITRAEMVAMLQRVLDKYDSDINVISENLYGSYWAGYWHQEDILLELTNQDRAKNGLAPLKKSANLTAEARIVALDLGLNGSVNNKLHDTIGLGGSGSAVEYTLGLGMIGQNATTDGSSGNKAFNAYLNSPGHHQATLGKNTVYFGAGFDDRGNNFENMKIPSDL